MKKIITEKESVKVQKPDSPPLEGLGEVRHTKKLYQSSLIFLSKIKTTLFFTHFSFGFIRGLFENSLGCLRKEGCFLEETSNKCKKKLKENHMKVFVCYSFLEFIKREKVDFFWSIFCCHYL